ncbi:unnamed protein product [Knipowitschia caucasica]
MDLCLILSVALWILICGFLISDVTCAIGEARLQYTRDVLLQLKSVCVTDFAPNLPDFIRRDFIESRQVEREGKKKKKRGKRGGVRERLKKQRVTRLPLPSVILGNVQSLKNKLEELQGNIRFQKDFKECCVLTFTETWLTDRDRDGDLRIDGFGTPYRLDRDADVTGKTQGGGVCFYLNERYCKSVTVREQVCTPDVELLSVSFRPYYLPREFPQLFFTVVRTRIQKLMLPLPPM